jgi:hypothetical protein
MNALMPELPASPIVSEIVIVPVACKVHASRGLQRR